MLSNLLVCSPPSWPPISPPRWPSTGGPARSASLAPTTPRLLLASSHITPAASQREDSSASASPTHLSSSPQAEAGSPSSGPTPSPSASPPLPARRSPSTWPPLRSRSSACSLPRPRASRCLMAWPTARMASTVPMRAKCLSVGPSRPSAGTRAPGLPCLSSCLRVRSAAQPFWGSASRRRWPSRGGTPSSPSIPVHSSRTTPSRWTRPPWLCASPAPASACQARTPPRSPRGARRRAACPSRARSGSLSCRPLARAWPRPEALRRRAVVKGCR
mmetsp:Transcript_50878/g.108675  ORF Transcript_50878/g.108675 Transcript_50878/m.108675 type:complete len:274 (+) Transcript_50878:611-1432(+)